LDTPSYTVR